MSDIKRLVLDVLKPHQPNALEFATNLVDKGGVAHAHVLVEGVDAKTESLNVIIEGRDVVFPEVLKAIEDMGGALQSIDEVIVEKSSSTD